MKYKAWVSCAVLALLFACTASVSAAEPLPADTDGSYTVEFTASANTPYVLLVLTDGTATDAITVDSILYIDQAMADEFGTVTFRAFQLRRKVNAQVYLAGAGLAAPANPHSILFENVEAAGQIPDGSAATVRLLAPGSATQVLFTALTDEAGGYAFENVPAGQYDLRIEKAGYITLTKRGVTVHVHGILDAVSIAAYAGDVDGSGVVNVYDLNALLTEFGNTGSEISNPAADLDGNGSVNAADLSRLLTNYNTGALGGITID